MKNKTYLVTGGSGFIGSALVHRLVKLGHTVKVFDNQSRGAARRLSGIENDIEFIEADIRNSESVEKAIKGVDSVCHLAFVNGTEFFYSKPELVLDVGVKGMVNVIDACLKHDVRELILASSSEVYQTPPEVPTSEDVPLSVPDPMNPRYSYGGGKIISELMTLNYGRKHFDKTIIFRPHNVYGPDMGWEHVIPQFILRMKELMQQKSDTKVQFPIQGTGDETRAFVFIEDFIDGVELLLTKGEHMSIYNIGTMDEVPISDVANTIAEYFGKNIDLVPGDLAKGGTLRRCPDIAKIQNLGYNPKYSLRDGLMITAKWYDENVRSDKKTKFS